MKMKFNTFLKDRKKNRFLNFYVVYGTIGKAAEKLEIDRSTHYVWLSNDDRYAAAFAKARKMAADLLEEEAWRRAVDGYERPVFHKGEEVGSVRHYSDALLTLLLKGAKPEVYKDRVENEIVGDGSADLCWEGVIENGGNEGEDNDTIQTG